MDNKIRPSPVSDCQIGLKEAQENDMKTLIVALIAASDCRCGRSDLPTLVREHPNGETATKEI
jgi:hypothetical protein